MEWGDKEETQAVRDGEESSARTVSAARYRGHTLTWRMSVRPLEPHPAVGGMRLESASVAEYDGRYLTLAGQALVKPA